MGALWAEPQLLLEVLRCWPRVTILAGCSVTLILAVKGVVTPMKGNGLVEQETYLLLSAVGAGEFGR